MSLGNYIRKIRLDKAAELLRTTDMSISEVGRNLTKENVINGKSMTIENLTMKLMWSLAHYKNITDIKDFMEKEL